MSGHAKLRQIPDQAPEPDPYMQDGVLSPRLRATKQHSMGTGYMESGQGAA